MSSDSPAAILFDESGNPVGIVYDGVEYRLQTDSRLTDGNGNYVGITNVVPGEVALKVDVIKTVASGGAGSGGTSSNFDDPFPIAGTAAGYSDGYYMRNARVFDLDTGLGTQYSLGVNLRGSGPGGSIEIGTSANPIRIDPTGVTTQPVSGTVTANAGSGTFTVAGAVTANAGTGNFTVVQGTAANLNATVVGTVTANIGTTNGLALDSSLTTIDTDIKATQPRDVTDRAGRLLGVIYGSQGQQLKQTATNFNTQVEIAVGGSLIDPRQIRALTSADVVTANAGSGTFTVSGTVTANAGTGNFTVVQATAANLNATVTGTVTANIGTTNGLALDTSVNGLLLSQGSSTSGEKGPLIQGAITTAAPTYTTAQTSPLSLTTGGALRVDASAADVSVEFDQDSAVTAFTAFSRLRVASPDTIFDCKLITDSAPLFFDDQQTSGGGTTSTYQTNQAMQKMSVSLNTAGTRVRQTFRRFNYQPGKSHLILCTGVLGSGTSGVTRRVGYFDQNNGLFFQLSGTTMSVVSRSFTSGSAVDTVVNQSSWNIDKLDGTGTSGITLDTSKTQIFLIDFQWLGVGRVRFGFDIAGVIRYCHQMLNANVSTLVYMSNPNLPIRYEISSTGTNAASDLMHICTSVISEGGIEDTGYVLSADRGVTAMTTLSNTNLYPVVSIRLKSGSLSATISALILTVVCSSNAAYRYALILNPTVAGTALSFSSITNSAIEADTTSTSATTITGGTLIISGYGQSGGSTGNTLQLLPSSLTIGSNIAGTADILVLAVSRVTGTSEDFFGSLTWREEI